MRVEIEAGAVDEAFESRTKDFQRQASLPGFRPGKAPRAMIAKRYEKDIETEVKRKLISEAYHKALEEQKLEVVGAPDIEEIQFGRGQALQFAVTFETAPEFQLPEYKGLPLQRETTTVTGEDVERAIQLLRERQTTFQTIDRPAQTGDVVVVNYTGASGGRPLTDLAPAAKGLTEQKGFWITLGQDSFIPGFADQLLGVQAADRRTVTVDFPADFVTPELAGQKGVYDVEVVEVKEKTLPALDDAFAKTYGAEDLGKLRAGVRTDLENELNFKKNRSLTNQLVEELLNRVSFELPEAALALETRNVVYDIVRENQQRGVPKDLIEGQKEQIYSAATASAKNRVKANFLLQKIAEREEIKVAQEEVAGRIYQLAAKYEIPPERFIKDLQKRNGVVQIYDQIANEKTIAFLLQNAAITDVAPAAPPPG